MRSIVMFVAMLVVGLVSGCTGPGFRMSILGGRSLSSGFQSTVPVKLMSDQFVLVNATVGTTKFFLGTDKHPEPFRMTYMQEHLFPLPEPVTDYSQMVELRFDVVTPDGQPIGFVSRPYRVESLPRNVGDNIRIRPPVTYPTWYVTEKDVHANPSFVRELSH